MHKHSHEVIRSHAHEARFVVSHRRGRNHLRALALTAIPTVDARKSNRLAMLQCSDTIIIFLSPPLALRAGGGGEEGEEVRRTVRKQLRSGVEFASRVPRLISLPPPISRRTQRAAQKVETKQKIAARAASTAARWRWVETPASRVRSATSSRSLRHLFPNCGV